MEDILKESGEARKYSISLNGQELAHELVAQMSSHSTYMHKVYVLLQKLVGQKISTMAVYKPIFDKVEEKQTWYKLRKAVLQSPQRCNCYYTADPISATLVLQLP